MARKRHRFDRGAFYKIVWQDILTEKGWVSVDGEKTDPAECISYGWVTDSTAQVVRLSATVGDNKDGSPVEYNQHISIPTGCIVSAVCITAP